MKMRAMLLHKTGNMIENRTPLTLVDIPVPVPKEKEILVKVSACGLCHTDLDEIEGRTPPERFPMILGHQVVGRVESSGKIARRFQPGERVGIGWIHSACGRCRFCRCGQENLCMHFKATGRDEPGGYAQYTTVNEEFAYRIPSIFSDAQAAPLLCAGAVGFRSLKLSDMSNGKVLGFYGFGASAHLVIQTARYRYPHAKFYVFARNKAEQKFSMDLKATWAGDIEATPPTKMDAVIDTTPVWRPIVMALKHLNPGGRVVINAIRKEEIDKKWLLNIDYTRHLWQEKEIKSVANITREDVSQFLKVASNIPIKPKVQEFTLKDVNHALNEIKTGKIKGAKVICVE
jgi:propanol-preferring alcohol dehydrogenase